MSRFKLSNKQVCELESFSKNTKSKLEHTRALAILNRYRGMTAQQSADSLQVTIVAVFKWCKRYLEYGIGGIRSKKHPGRQAVIKKAAVKIIPKLLKEDPQAFGYLKGRWVVRDIAGVLRKEGVNIGYRYVAQILHELGFAYKRPKLTVKSNDSQYYTKAREVRNYKRAAAALAKKGFL